MKLSILASLVALSLALSPI